MKTQFKIIGWFAFTGLLVSSCMKPEIDRNDISGVANGKVDFAVSQSNGNVILTLNNTNAVPYWEIRSDPDMALITTGNKRVDTVVIPFAGDYWVKCYGYFNSGFTADSQKFNVAQNSPAYFSDPRWNYLTNGEAGKTWTLDMTAPLGFYGTTWPDPKGSDTWIYYPQYADATWTMPNRDYGTMTFDLNGGFHYTKTALDASGAATTTSGSFTLDLKAGTISINGPDLLWGGDYATAVKSMSLNLKVIKIAQDSLIIAPYRVVSPCWLGFAYKPKS